MTPQQQTLLRTLPSIDKLLLVQEVAELKAQFGRKLLLEALRTSLDQQRIAIREGEVDEMDSAEIITTAHHWLSNLIAPTLRPVINATGVIIHTNLGRSPLSQPALAAIATVARGYSNLEYDLPAGARGSRSTHAASLISRLTGVPAATVVNNAASAVLLMLSALCAGQEVIVSRGQLVEIGGGFRMPDVMRQAGVKLVEVGTTNRTHLRDYAHAITADTAAILVIHNSNYKIVGFTSQPSLSELADLAHNHDLPMLYDQGSGALLDTTQFGLEREGLVQESVAAGCDVVVFSGDKLIGGPQAGLIAGRADLLATIKRHPLARAVRPDKLAYAALGATLASYITGHALQEIPIWWMLARPLTELKATATTWQAELAKAGIAAQVIAGNSTVGGGSLPGQVIPTYLLALENARPERIAQRLRSLDLPIIGRIQNNTLTFDPRTILPHQQTAFLTSLKKLSHKA